MSALGERDEQQPMTATPPATDYVQDTIEAEAIQHLLDKLQQCLDDPDEEDTQSCTPPTTAQSDFIIDGEVRQHLIDHFAPWAEASPPLTTTSSVVLTPEQRVNAFAACQVFRDELTDQENAMPEPLRSLPWASICELRPAAAIGTTSTTGRANSFPHAFVYLPTILSLMLLLALIPTALENWLCLLRIIRRWWDGEYTGRYEEAFVSWIEKKPGETVNTRDMTKERIEAEVEKALYRLLEKAQGVE